MTFEPSDYQELQHRKMLELRDKRRPQLQRAQQAAVAMEQLTGSAEWDYFLTLVSSRREELRDQMEAASSMLLGSEVNRDALESARLSYREARAALDVVEFVLDLPRQVIERGAEAKRALDAS